MSDTTTVIVVTPAQDYADDLIAGINRSWLNQDERLVQATTGGYKAGDLIWCCVYSHLNEAALTGRILAEMARLDWPTPVTVLLRYQDDDDYRVEVIEVPEPGSVQEGFRSA